MSKEMAVIALGVFAIIIPYLGMPGPLRTVLIILTGIAVMVVGFLLRAQALSQGPKHTSRHPFIESNTARVTKNYSDEHKEGISSLN